MASISAVFTEKERTNWLKAWLAVEIAKSGLEDFVEIAAKALHATIYDAVWSRVHAPAACIGCDTAKVLKCPANVCNEVYDEIAKRHKYSSPSWRNTTAKQWATNPWQIAKSYLPPDGYAGKNSCHDTDMNGIIHLMMNCKHFDTMCPPCLLTKAREICRTVRYLSQCKVTDQDLQDTFTTLTNLLSYHSAWEAARKLAELQNDTLEITTQELVHLIKAVEDKLKAVKNIPNTNLDEIRMYHEKCKHVESKYE